MFKIEKFYNYDILHLLNAAWFEPMSLIVIENLTTKIVNELQENLYDKKNSAFWCAYDVHAWVVQSERIC